MEKPIHVIIEEKKVDEFIDFEGEVRLLAYKYGYSIQEVIFKVDGNLVAKLAKKKYCIVESAQPIPIGSDGDYHFEYEITVVDGEGWTFLQDDYHILSDKEVEKIENGFRL